MKRRVRGIQILLIVAMGAVWGCDVVVSIEEFLRTLFNCDCACHCVETYLRPDEQTAGGSLRCVNRTDPSQSCSQVCTNLSIGQSLGGGGIVVCQ